MEVSQKLDTTTRRILAGSARAGESSERVLEDILKAQVARISCVVIFIDHRRVVRAKECANKFTALPKKEVIRDLFIAIGAHFRLQPIAGRPNVIREGVISTLRVVKK